MRVQLYPADASGCGMYRCILPGNALAAEGVDVSIHMPNDKAGMRVKVGTLRTTGKQVVAGVERLDADVVVLQRPMLWALIDTIPFLQRQGVAVIVEIDDDFEAVQRANVNWRLVQPHVNPAQNKDHLARACQQADLVIASTPSIAARYGRHGRVKVIRNYVPRSYLSIERDAPNERPVLGWAGSTEVHPTDLPAAGHRLARALRSADASFRVIGDGIGVKNALRLSDEPEVMGWLPFADYPPELVRLDVAIAPLDPHPFNEAKSWLKPLEAAAVGVPCVASPTSEYRLLAERGGCRIAEKPGEWEHHVARLLRMSTDQREAVGAVAREAAAGLVVEDHLDEWQDAWRTAIDNRKANTT